jgi:hypothetical protein
MRRRKLQGSCKLDAVWCLLCRERRVARVVKADLRAGSLDLVKARPGFGHAWIEYQKVKEARSTKTTAAARHSHVGLTLTSNSYELLRDIGTVVQ